jgi:hypothetical protein
MARQDWARQGTVVARQDKIDKDKDTKQRQRQKITTETKTPQKKDTKQDCSLVSKIKRNTLYFFRLHRYKKRRQRFMKTRQDYARLGVD